MSVTLLGVPYDAASSYRRGPASAPARIREALCSDATNGWTELLVDTRAPGVMRDAGDVAIDEQGDVVRQIDEAATRVVGADTRPIFLGGDHSISYPLVRAVRRRFPRLTIVHFDAHPDLYDELDGNRHSHACPFARIMEAGLADRLVQMGIRTMNAHQRAQAERFGVEVSPMRDWVDGRAWRFEGPCYVTVDLDVLDPAFAPGVSHHEPGGLSVRQLLTVIQNMDADIVAADVVEYNPALDPGGITSWVAAKIVRELAGRMVER